MKISIDGRTTNSHQKRTEKGTKLNKHYNEFRRKELKTEQQSFKITIE